MAKILEGRTLSLVLATRLAKKIERLKTKPKLVIIQIGNLEESNTYIKNKKIFAEKVGVIAEHKRYPNNVKEAQVISDIKRFNRDHHTHGIMVQLPAPKHFDIERVLESIDSKKESVRISSKVGERKRKEIIKRSKELNLKILNA